jgi:hypothetical protein
MRSAVLFKSLRVALIVVVTWAVLVGLCILMLWPSLPTSSRQWGFLVAFGPPAYLGLELLGEWLFSTEHGYAISKKRGTSGARILVAVVVMSVLLVGILWLSARILK